MRTHHHIYISWILSFLILRKIAPLPLRLALKRLIDIIGSVLIFIVFSPLILFALIGIKLTSPGPIIFKQKRIGKDGEEFTIYKFRSMIHNAEKLQAAIADQNIMSGPVFKVKDDPRITPLGKLLRKTSIDELPQLWNVFKGEMSLVGPRPPLRSEVEQYKGWQRRRLSVKPGLTCLWQINGRNNIINFDKWVKLDLQYIDNWSLSLDLLILLKTVAIVLLGIGAE
ncbi:MAG: exopolysaccharide biosynthesis polyprenyl glycosylphosphotransferase [Candidatus Omnitrophica bacterium]|nr:exopolysaccharide biosynthesis polyprenyl glycosylphosphotransferase [Candidatus Omnitrophota bacterium]